MKLGIKVVVLLILLMGLVILVETAYGNETLLLLGEGGPKLVWWQWSLILFLFTSVLGAVAILSGLGGGVLYVPIVSSLFPFHLDFVRGAGLFVALSGALSASPGLLKKGLANIRVALPMAVVSSLSSIFGAEVGLALPSYVIQIILGFIILGIVVLMFISKKSDFPEVLKSDKLSKKLKIYGKYYDESLEKEISWRVHRTPQALILFVFIGFMAGMFGLGAGWANVPVLNQVLGVPLKVSAASSILILAITDTAAAWVYLLKGAELVLITVPSVVGMMLGARLGVKLLTKAKPSVVKWVVISFLSLAGVRSLLKGFGIWD